MWGLSRQRGPSAEAAKAFFKSWDDSKGITQVRKLLRHDPSPWRAFMAVHEANHLLQDKNCRDLLEWTRVLLMSERDHARRKHIYQMGMEMFNVLVARHKPGLRARSAFYALCADAGDMSSAHRWFNYFAESGDGQTLADCAWLLRVAARHPSPEAAAEMLGAVLDVLRSATAATAAVAGGSRGGGGGGQEPSTLIHIMPDEPMEAAQEKLAVMDAAAEVLRTHNITDAALRNIVSNQMFCDAQTRAMLRGQGAGPTAAESPRPAEGRVPHHLQLLFGDDTVINTLGRRRADGAGSLLESGREARDVVVDPRPVCGSLLLEPLAAALERGAAAGDREAVINCIEVYKRGVAAEIATSAAGELRAPSAIFKTVTQDDKQFWKAFVAFGHSGVTAELYHHLVVALSAAAPGLIVTVMESIEHAAMRPLDITRAIAACALIDDAEQAGKQIAAYFADYNYRTKLDADHEIRKAHEAYWSYDYPLWLHYVNALTPLQFLVHVGLQCGPAKLQQALVQSRVFDSTHHLSGGSSGSSSSSSSSSSAAPTDPHSLAIVSEEYCLALREVLLRCGPAAKFSAEDALTFITHNAPTLDIALVGRVSHFADYTLPQSREDVWTSVADLRSGLRGYQDIYLLDASFVEASERFASICHGHTKQNDGSSGSALVLVPYVTLMQLQESFIEPETLDPDFLGEYKRAREIGMHRLQQLARLVRSGCAEVLHLTECLLAHNIASLGDRAEASPMTQAQRLNLHLARVAVLLNSISRDGCGSGGSAEHTPPNVYLCSDDPEPFRMIDQLEVPREAAEGIRWVTTYDQEVSEAESTRAVTTMDPSSSVGTNVLSFFESAQFEPVLASQRSHGSAATASTEGGEKRKSAASSATAEAPVSPWIDMMTAMDPDEGEERSLLPSGSGGSADVGGTGDVALAPGRDETLERPATLATQCRSKSGSTSGSTSSSAGSDGGKVVLEEVFRDPTAIKSLADELGEAKPSPVFHDEFGVPSPEQLEARQKPRSLLDAEGKPKRNRSKTLLQQELHISRPLSWRQKHRAARHLSNQLGAKVPGHFRYNRFVANVNDPRNRALVRAYREGIETKRRAFRMQKFRRELASQAEPEGY